MSRSEVLNGSLISLNATHKELSEIWAQEIAGALGIVPGDTVRPKGNAESVLGPPKFDNAKDYLAWRKEQGLD